jgi:transcriptional regulator with XRE-family HTH domain
VNYGRAIRIARTVRGLSQKALAKLVSLDASSVSLLEAGKRSPSIEALERIAATTGMPLYLLILLASEREGLHGMPEEDAQRIGSNLLGWITEGETK